MFGKLLGKLAVTSPIERLAAGNTPGRTRYGALHPAKQTPVNNCEQMLAEGVASTHHQ